MQKKYIKNSQEKIKERYDAIELFSNKIFSKKSLQKNN